MGIVAVARVEVSLGLDDIIPHANKENSAAKNEQDATIGIFMES